jgi:propionate catabolism operon transcriptional regulator
MQAKLLRVLENGEVVRVGANDPIRVNVRIISATHCDLERRVGKGEFRADLFYRLGVLRIAIPPLRARQDDVIELAAWCLKNALAEMGVRPGANLRAELQGCASVLQSYHWPGNVRELRNLMQRVALFLSVEPLQALTPAFLNKLAPEMQQAPPLPAFQETQPLAPDVEAVVAQFGGNRAEAAAFLGISRTTLWRRLKSSQPV